MPIKEHNRKKYPKHWKEISDLIRFERAKERCECEGECGLHHNRRCTERHGQAAEFAKGKVILTVSHLCHDETCDVADHLKAMCQRCHLRYDSKHHQRNARETRYNRRALNDLFHAPAPV